MQFLENRVTIGRLNKGFKTFYGNQWGRLDYETHFYVGTKGEI